MSESNLAVRSDDQPLDPAFALMLAQGDYSKASESQKSRAIMERCRVLDIDPRAAPFMFIPAGGRTFMYATAGCSSALSLKHKVGTRVTKTERIEDVFIVSVRAFTADGRETDDIGAVTVGGLKGDSLANAMMKAHTKATRRAIMKHCGLAMPDESELETIPGVRVVANTAPPPEPQPAEESIGDERAHAIRNNCERRGITKEMLAARFNEHPDNPIADWPASRRDDIKAFIEAHPVPKPAATAPAPAKPASTPTKPGPATAEAPEYWIGKLKAAAKAKFPAERPDVMVDDLADKNPKASLDGAAYWKWLFQSLSAGIIVWPRDDYLNTPEPEPGPSEADDADSIPF